MNIIMTHLGKGEPMKTYRISNINWYTDELDNELPNDFLINVNIKEGATELEIEEKISEAVSDEYFSLHFGFDYTESE